MRRDENVTTVNYDGGGWTIPYLIGVSARLSESESDLTDAGVVLKFAGVSAGACVALASALGASMDDLMEDVMKESETCRLCPLLTLRSVRSICDKTIEGDDQARRLESFAVGVTRVSPGKRFVGDGKLKTVVFSKFEGKEDLVEKVVSSCRLPMINTLPSVDGVPYEYIDGNLLTRFIETPWRAHEVRVSPNSGAAGSDVSCREVVPLPYHIVPYRKDGLRRLYELGKIDGTDVLDRILSFDRGEKILRTDQDEPAEYDWSTCFYKRLHVDRRRDFRLSEENVSSEASLRPSTRSTRPRPRTGEDRYRCRAVRNPRACHARQILSFLKV